jgi:hypothetical protein
MAATYEQLAEMRRQRLQRGEKVDSGSDEE